MVDTIFLVDRFGSNADTALRAGRGGCSPETGSWPKWSTKAESQIAFGAAITNDGGLNDQYHAGQRRRSTALEKARIVAESCEEPRDPIQHRGKTMIRMSRAAGFSITAVIGLLFSTISVGVANAAEIRVLASVALAAVINELKPQFERATSNTVSVLSLIHI